MQEVIENFKKICAIPHCSFETQKLKNFLADYAKECGFKVQIDKVGNVHCIKGEPKICLQSHYDMVCMGEAPVLELYEEEGFLKARNSSLGADNGIGVAIMMEAMRHFSHLECLFTNDEEVGLLGANGLECEIKAEKLLNLDHEGEDEIMIGCAGGVDIKAFREFSTQKAYGKVYELEAKNFKGGHSGIDIIKNHKNALKEMARFIAKNEGQIISFEGGERINSIPKHAKALIICDKDLQENEWIKCTFKGEQEVQICKQSKLLLSVINAFANGVRNYDTKLHIVKTSINLSLLRMQEGRIIFELFARSNALEELQNLEFETLEFFKSCTFEVESSNFYPPWEGKESILSQEVFNALSKFVKNVKISAIHAGLECGIIEKKFPLMCVSIGPNIYNPHSTDERCELSSVEKISKAVFEVLKNNQ